MYPVYPVADRVSRNPVTDKVSGYLVNVFPVTCMEYCLSGNRYTLPVYDKYVLIFYG